MQFDLKKNREKLGMECRSLLQRRNTLKNETLQLQEYLNVLSVSSDNWFLVLRYFDFSLYWVWTLFKSYTWYVPYSCHIINSDNFKSTLYCIDDVVNCCQKLSYLSCFWKKKFACQSNNVHFNQLLKKKRFGVITFEIIAKIHKHKINFSVWLELWQKFIKTVDRRE